LSAASPAYRLHPRWDSLDALVAANADADGLLRIDLGCGHNKPDGYVGLDDLSGAGAQIADAANAPDIDMDLNHAPLPFAAASVAEARASHFLEHSNLDHVFAEVHRVLAPGGVFLFVVPYANSAAGMFPGHAIFLTETFFEQNLAFQQRFAIDRIRYEAGDAWRELPWVVRRLLPFDIARKVLFNVCVAMTVWASARADAR
jgi:SAM-dependent methyltransferase